MKRRMLFIIVMCLFLFTSVMANAQNNPPMPNSEIQEKKLETELEEANKEIETLKSELEKTQSELTAVTKERDKFKKKCRNFKKKYETASDKIKELEAEILSLQQVSPDPVVNQEPPAPEQPEEIPAPTGETFDGAIPALQESDAIYTAPAEGVFDADLGAGVYTAGKDIPVGRYNLTAISGSGNVHSSLSINELMAYPADSYYIDSFTGLSLSSGDKLEIGSTLVLHIHSDNAKIYDMTSRQIGAEQEVILSAGNYIAGIDFPVGVYNIIGYEGSGNVHSYEADVNELFATFNDDMYITQFNNADFPEGASLEVSGCSVWLVPVGK